MSNSSANKLIDHFFRNEFGKAVAFLTGKYGTSQLETAEDAVQDALIKAMQTWPYTSIPDNPSGWIIRVAQNKLIDQLRRKQKVFYATTLPEIEENPPDVPEGIFNDGIVKMMFACCNPDLSKEYQLILTLKILGGLSIREMASSLLKKEETIAKAYTRAKKRFKEKNLKLEIPSSKEIQTRLQTVLKVIYLLFNEGYKTTEGDLLMRKDLCEEAMRLNGLLLDKKETNNEYTRSLMALMHYHTARFNARVDAEGQPILLEEQDRSKWDQKHIELGNRYLASIQQGANNEYFIQAGILGIHCNAESFEETNWNYILQLYDQLFRLKPSPVVALNRIIPFQKIHGPRKALEALKPIEKEPSLQNSYLLYAIKADIYREMNEPERAADQLKLAIERSENHREKELLQKRLETLKLKLP